MKLYTLFRSSASFRVRIALALKAVPYESVPKALLKNEHRTTEYLQINPQGLIPALDVGGEVLTQSMSIIEYLEETHPTPPLLPTEPVARAHVRALAQAVACDIHPINNLRVLNYLKETLHHDQATVDNWYRHWITIGFTGLEPMLKRYSAEGRYCFGDAVSMADICLLPQVYNANRFKTDLTPFPTIRSIAAHLETQPAFIAARPEAQPDAL